MLRIKVGDVFQDQTTPMHYIVIRRVVSSAISFTRPDNTRGTFDLPSFRDWFNRHHYINITQQQDESTNGTQTIS